MALWCTQLTCSAGHTLVGRPPSDHPSSERAQDRRSIANLSHRTALLLSDGDAGAVALKSSTSASVLPLRQDDVVAALATQALPPVTS
jgi:hypothetical protein